MGLFSGSVAGAVGGICVTIDTAIAEKLLTEAEVEKLGLRMGESFRTQAQQNPNVKITVADSDQLTVDPSSTICNRFLN